MGQSQKAQCPLEKAYKARTLHATLTIYIYLSCYHKIQYSNSHPQRANIPVRTTARVNNSARAPTTTRAMCHGSRGTKRDQWRNKRNKNI